MILTDVSRTSPLGDWPEGQKPALAQMPLGYKKYFDGVEHICEIQLQHEKLYDARENKGAHGHYEKIRKILESTEQYTDETRENILEKLRNSAKSGPKYLHPADVLFICVK